MQSGLIVLTATNPPSVNLWQVLATLPVKGAAPLGSVGPLWETQWLFGRRPHRAEIFWSPYKHRLRSMESSNGELRT